MGEDLLDQNDPLMVITHELNFRNQAGRNMKLASGNYYLPAIAGAMTAGRRVNNGKDNSPQPCTKCAKGGGRLQDCIQVRSKNGRLLKGSCTNCAFTNHLEDCSLSDNCKSSLFSSNLKEYS